MMRHSTFKIENLKFLPLLFLPLLLYACGMGDWRVYDTSEFSIEFPGPARDTVTIMGENAGSESFYEPAPNSLDSNLYYSVSLYSLPDSISLVKENMFRLFESDVQIYAWSIGGTLIDTGRVVKSGNVEGREYQVIVNGNRGISTVRKFAIGKHLYTLRVVTENTKLGNHEIKYFMESFKLKTKK